MIAILQVQKWGISPFPFSVIGAKQKQAIVCSQNEVDYNLCKPQTANQMVKGYEDAPFP